MKLARNLVAAAKPLVERFPRLALLYRLIRDSRFLTQKSVLTPFGFSFIGNVDMQKGVFEKEEAYLVNKMLEEADIFINIGANVGYYCCIALSMDRPVVAFEPIGLNLRLLYRNIMENNWGERIEIYPMALGDKSQLIEIYGGGTGASLVKGWSGIPETYKTIVPMTTLDNVIGARLSGKRCFIIVDIEGAESRMIQGAKTVLELDPKPVWMVEIASTAHQPDGVKVNPDILHTFDAFFDAGYDALTAVSYTHLTLPTIYSV